MALYVADDDSHHKGASRGFIIGHVCPEAFVGGPLALVQDGDRITVDAVERSINWHVEEAEIARRRAEFEARGPLQHRYKRGVLLRYARDVAVSRYRHCAQLRLMADRTVRPAREPGCVLRLKVDVKDISVTNHEILASEEYSPVPALRRPSVTCPAPGKLGKRGGRSEPWASHFVIWGIHLSAR